METKPLNISNLDNIENLPEVPISTSREVNNNSGFSYVNTTDSTVYEKSKERNKNKGTFSHKFFKTMVLIMVIIFIFLVIGFVKVEVLRDTETFEKIQQPNIKVIDDKALEYIETFNKKLPEIENNEPCIETHFYKINLLKQEPCILKKQSDQRKEAISSLKTNLTSYLNQTIINDKSSKNQQTIQDEESSKYLKKNTNDIDIQMFKGLYIEKWFEEKHLDPNSKDLKSNNYMELYEYDRFLILSDQLSDSCTINLTHFVKYDLKSTLSNNIVKKNLQIGNTVGGDFSGFLDLKSNPNLLVKKEHLVFSNSLKGKTGISFDVKQGDVLFIPAYYYFDVEGCVSNLKEKLLKTEFLSFALNTNNRNLNNLMYVIINGY